MRDAWQLGSMVVGALFLLAGCTFHPAIDPVAFLSPDGVTIEFGVPTCNADLDAMVIESDARVEVTITAQNDTTDDCRDVHVIVLDDRLNGRELVNGSTGETFEVRLVGN